MSESTGAGGVATVDCVVLDVPDVEPAGRFWQDLTGGEVEQDQSEGFLTLRTPDGWSLGFQPAPNLVRAQWPGQEHPQQVHLDLQVPDVAAATRTAVELGATLLSETERWNTLTDPAGHPFDLCLSEGNQGLTVMGVTFDVPDAHEAAVFWSRVLGDPITYDADGLAMLGGPKALLFQQVADYSAPRWPDPEYPQQLHLDLWTGEHSIDDAEALAIEAGASRLPGEGRGFRVFADPAGHPFCLLG